MPDKDLVEAYGICAETMKLMADLAHQVKAQGGIQEDLFMLRKEQVMSRVAMVLMRAGRLKRPLLVASRLNGEEEQIINEIHLIEWHGKFSEFERAVPNEICRLASRAELEDMVNGYRDLLYDEYELTIIGERIGHFGESYRHWTVNRSLGAHVEYYKTDAETTERARLAIIFCKSSEAGIGPKK